MSQITGVNFHKIRTFFGILFSTPWFWESSLSNLFYFWWLISAEESGPDFFLPNEFPKYIISLRVSKFNSPLAYMWIFMQGSTQMARWLVIFTEEVNTWMQYMWVSWGKYFLLHDKNKFIIFQLFHPSANQRHHTTTILILSEHMNITTIEYPMHQV